MLATRIMNDLGENGSLNKNIIFLEKNQKFTIKNPEMY